MLRRWRAEEYINQQDRGKGRTDPEDETYSSHGKMVVFGRNTSHHPIRGFQASIRPMLGFKRTKSTKMSATPPRCNRHARRRPHASRSTPQAPELFPTIRQCGVWRTSKKGERDPHPVPRPTASQFAHQVTGNPNATSRRQPPQVGSMPDAATEKQCDDTGEASTRAHCTTTNTSTRVIFCSFVVRRPACGAHASDIEGACLDGEAGDALGAATADDNPALELRCQYGGGRARVCGKGAGVRDPLHWPVGPCCQRVAPHRATC